MISLDKFAQLFSYEEESPLYLEFVDLMENYVNSGRTDTAE